MPIGLLIVGINGATANTTVVGTMLGTERELHGGSIINALPRNLVERFPHPSEFVFGGWDSGPDADAFDLARGYAILPPHVLARPRGSRIPVYQPIVTRHDVRELVAKYPFRPAQDQVERIREDIAMFRAQNAVSQCVVIYLASPGVEVDSEVHSWDADAFHEALSVNDDRITSSMLYCQAALSEGCAFVDFTPTATLEIPAFREIAEREGLPIAGRDGSTGQTLLKAVLGEMLRNRGLRLTGWYSTNLLGNNDGLVLSRPEHSTIKMSDKRDVLAPVIGYEDFTNLVEINYYAPRGDNKESWDLVDFAGWHDQAMSFRVNWLGRDSILAAPLVLDLARHMFVALRLKKRGLLDYLDVYFKRPLGKGWRPFSEMYGDLVRELQKDCGS
ncbi:inositol-3-phosphate synthase [Actinoplanes sp. NPDC051851]|uniref:inositol-3-phosphate synthase n=1 Tax=Actinoplanes sp. NPDC051851 TaxID=3154753 RepID=UPI003434B6D5